MSEYKDFNNKFALVTGAAGGIGYEIALALAKAGCAVCVLDLDADRVRQAAAAIQDQGGEAFPLAHSIADATVIEAVRTAGARSKRQGFDLLVNAAGISPKKSDGLRSPAWETSPAQWAEVIQTNLNGTFHTVSAVLPGMIKRGRGAIVNIGSLAGRRYSGIAGAAYATSKGAVEAMTRQFAGEVAQHGVRINVVSPGRIQTPMAAVAGEEFNEQIRMQTPLHRLGMPSDIADAVIFLLSDRASFITGETLVVSGGRGL